MDWKYMNGGNSTNLRYQTSQQICDEEEGHKRIHWVYTAHLLLTLFYEPHKQWIASMGLVNRLANCEVITILHSIIITSCTPLCWCLFHHHFSLVKAFFIINKLRYSHSKINGPICILNAKLLEIELPRVSSHSEILVICLWINIESHCLPYL